MLCKSYRLLKFENEDILTMAYNWFRNSKSIWRLSIITISSSLLLVVYEFFRMETFKLPDNCWTMVTRNACLSINIVLGGEGLQWRLGENDLPTIASRGSIVIIRSCGCQQRIGDEECASEKTLQPAV